MIPRRRLCLRLEFTHGQRGSTMETHDSSSDVATDTPVEDHTPTEEAPAPDTAAADSFG